MLIFWKILGTFISQNMNQTVQIVSGQLVDIDARKIYGAELVWKPEKSKPFIKQKSKKVLFYIPVLSMHTFI